MKPMVDPLDLLYPQVDRFLQGVFERHYRFVTYATRREALSSVLKNAYLLTVAKECSFGKTPFNADHVALDHAAFSHPLEVFQKELPKRVTYDFNPEFLVSSVNHSVVSEEMRKSTARKKKNKSHNAERQKEMDDFINSMGAAMGLDD